jgi:ketosteroid isomerase-like protein
MRHPHFRGILVLAVAIVAAALLGRISNRASMAAVNEREALMRADRDFDKATAETGVKGWVSHFAEDGQMFPAGAEMVSGRQAIREAMAPAFANPEFSLRWKPLGADVSRAGDLGYTYGTYVAKGAGPQRQTVERHGKYVSVWKKQADGSWKVVVDIGNSSPAPPTP